MKVVFIGLGNMGAPMARNLMAQGIEVAGIDPAGVPKGIPAARSLAEAAAQATVAITMLPSGEVLSKVSADLHRALPAGAVHLDCSTVDVASARAVAASASDAGLMCVDAPVSGGTTGAEAGTLTFMAGGTAEALGKVAPLLDIMGQKTVHCGAEGAGQAAKICNNMILGTTMIATCEAFALADKLGLERQSMYDVVSTSSGQSWSMTTYCPAPGVGPQSPSDAAYTPGFSAALMLKDLRLSQQAAATTGAQTPIGARATELYADMVELQGMGGMDFSAMLTLLSDD